VRVPPFTACFDPDDPLRYRNYAVPDDGAEPDAAAVERLREVFGARERLPRLEWVEEAAPRLAPALAACGMAEELRAPLMACAPGALLDPTVDVGGLAVALVRDADLRDLADIQRAAFGESPLAEGDKPRDPRAFGGGAVLARVSEATVAAAAWTAIVDGVSEIAGVATSEPWRGRGLAGAITAAACRAAFAAGASLCILSPGNETAQRVYARAGFSRAATSLYFSD
jgi:RimJ/RimL family protein N-acetyltransferase